MHQHLGHQNIANRFRIPATHEFPIELHDAAFGQRCKMIRHMYKKNQLSRDHINMLEKENMIWDAREHNFQSNLR